MRDRNDVAVADVLDPQSGAVEVRAAKRSLVRGMAWQWGSGLVVFALLNIGAALKDQADRKAAGLSAFTAAKAWLLSLDSGVGYTWMAVAAALLIAMAVGAPRPRELDSKLATRFEEIDTQLQFGVVAIGVSSVIVGAAMYVGAENGTDEVTVRVAAGTATRSVALPHAGRSYMLEVLAVMSVLVITFVAAAMTQSLEKTRETLRAAYAYIDDANLDHIDGLIRSWTCNRPREILRAPRRKFLWPDALVVAAFSTTLSSAVIWGAIIPPGSASHISWWTLIPTLFIVTIFYVRTAAAILGQSRARPRNLTLAAAITFIYGATAAFPITLLSHHGFGVQRIVLLLEAILTIPALLGIIAVWLPTWRRWPWSARLAAYGLIKAIRGTKRSTTAKVKYLDELRRTSWMELEVASRSRRHFEVVRASRIPADDRDAERTESEGK